VLQGAVAAPFPGFIEPQLATLRVAVPSGAEWIHEIKFDGYRVQGHLVTGKPTLITRGGHDWTHRMRAVADALGRLPANHLVIDGEIIVPAETGASDFSALKAAIGSSGQSHRLLFYVFDLLHLDGFDLRAAPLIDRKRVLQDLLEGVGPPILLSDHMEGRGQEMFRKACEMGLEGVISKRGDAPYRSGRVGTWVKVKCSARETFTVIGFAPEGKSLTAALHLARKSGRNLTYVGKVGTGWSMEQSADLRSRLERLAIEAPVVLVPGRPVKTVWVRPTLQVDVEYRAQPAAGQLRHAVWRGMKAAACR
jgi:bifunctional non-homologous end joining protein LigD